MGDCDMGFFKEVPLTKEQQNQVGVLYAQGYCDAQIAMKMRVAKCQIRYWRQRRKLPFHKGLDIRVIKKNIKESLPSFATPCITLATDKYLAELDLKRWGNDVKPISAPLSERSKALNLGGQIVGLAYRK